MGIEHGHMLKFTITTTTITKPLIPNKLGWDDNNNIDIHNNNIDIHNSNNSNANNNSSNNNDHTKHIL
jgi:hypothetical protein